MTASTRFSQDVLWVWALLALAAGCTGLDVREQPVAPGGCNNVAQKRRQRTEPAVREFESKPDRAEFQAAMAHWARGDVEAYNQGLQGVLARNPDHRDARLLMAEVYLTENQTREAIDHVEQSLRAHPDDAHVQYTTGLPLDTAGQGNSTLAYYERAAELGADKMVTTVAHQTALPAAEQVEPSPADPTGQSGDSPRTSLQRPFLVPDPTAYTVKSPPTLAVKRPNRPNAAAGADDKPQPSTTPDRDSQTETSDRVDLADSAETTEKNQLRVLSSKGRETLTESSDQAALVHFRKAEAIRPDSPQIPISAAIAALQHDRPELAIELLRPAERRFSGSARLYRILGLSFYRLGDYQSSQVALRQALSLDKSSALSYLLMGCTLSKLGQFESAEAHLRQARTINPRYTVRR